MDWGVVGSFYLLLVSFIGFITLGLILFSIKSNRLVNIFLVLVFVLACIRMLIRSTYDLHFQQYAQALRSTASRAPISTAQRPLHCRHRNQERKYDLSFPSHHDH